MDLKYTELLIHGVTVKRWQVVQRANVDRPLERDEYKVLATFTSKVLAVAWAEGRASVTGQVIRMS
jgi:hypothetical protein